MGPLDLGDLSEFRKFQTNSSSSPATSVDNSAPGNNSGLKFDPRTNTMIGENAPEGFRRYWAGFRDLFHGDKDFDQRGHGGGVESKEGYGRKGPNTEIIDGKVVKGPDLEAEIAKEERQEGYWDRRVDKLEGIAQRGQKRQMIHGGLTNMGKSIMEGTIRGADSLDRAQSATATMIANMPKLQLTAMKYAQQQDYGLG